MRTYRCDYCGCKLVEDWRGNCLACGAPAGSQDNRCSCGLLLDEEATLSFSNVMCVCHNCFETFTEDIVGQYRGDKYYKSGAETHLFETERRTCPNCGNTLLGHEFYHNLPRGSSKEEVVAFCKINRGKP